MDNLMKVHIETINIYKKAFSSYEIDFEGSLGGQSRISGTARIDSELVDQLFQEITDQVVRDLPKGNK